MTLSLLLRPFAMLGLTMLVPQGTPEIRQKIPCLSGAARARAILSVARWSRPLPGIGRTSQ